MKPSSFDAEFFTDSDELDEPDMIFLNFWVGPEGQYLVSKKKRDRSLSTIPSFQKKRKIPFHNQ